MASSDASIPETMLAVVTTGIGGYDRLSVRHVPVPRPMAGEVLLKVLAAGLNNTDINTRTGWYGAPGGDTTGAADDGAPNLEGWNGATPFPLIQGADCCGRVVAVGEGVASSRIGERVLVRPCMRVHGFDRPETRWLGVDFNGAFAEYVAVPGVEAFAVRGAWSDTALASLPCASGTAEAMLQRAAVRSGETVLVPGASGGVGSAAVQLAKARGARVIALTRGGKADHLQVLGADGVATSVDDVTALAGPHGVDVIIDTVGGADFPDRLTCLGRGGRLVTSGAIAGAVVTLDLRELYLHDRTLIGSTAWADTVFPALITAVETNAIRPVLAATYPLSQIEAAQRAFLDKRHVGKIVLIPPN